MTPTKSATCPVESRSFAALRRVAVAVALLTLATSLSGCYAGAAALIYALAVAGDSSGGSSPVPQAVISSVGNGIIQAGDGHPDRVEIRYRIVNGDERRRLSFQWRECDGADLRPATEAPGAAVPGTFVWDAGTDLRSTGGGVDRSALVSFIVTPDGSSAADETSCFRAGNTRAIVDDVRLSQSGDDLEVSFRVLDDEASEVEIDSVRLGVDGEFHDAPVPLLTEIREATRGRLRGSPSGSLARFSFSVGKLDQGGDEVDASLRSVGRPGFKGELQVSVCLRDFDEPTSCAEGPSEARFVFDNNDPPGLEILPPLPGDLETGLVPIRMRITDRERNDVDLRVCFGDAGGEPAPGFPSRFSSSVSGLSTGDPSGGADGFHTFLFDSRIASLFAEESQLTLIATDAEESLAETFALGRLSLSKLVREDELEAGLNPLAAAVDDFYLRDGIDDLAVLNAASEATTASRGSVTLYKGTPGGLVHQGEVRVGHLPVDLRVADFNGDGHLDIAVASRLSFDLSFPGGDVTLIPGSADGPLTDTVTFPLGFDDLRPRIPTALETGDFNGDGKPDLAVANGVVDSVTLYFGVDDPVALVFAEEILAVGVSPVALLGGKFDADGIDDLVVLVTGDTDIGSLTFLKGVAQTDTVSGGLQRVAEIPVGAAPVALVSGYFDDEDTGERYLDLVVANSGDATVSFVTGTPEGPSASSSPQEIKVGLFPRALAAGDIDDDGFDDVVVVNRDFNAALGASSVTSLMGSRDGICACYCDDVDCPCDPSRCVVEIPVGHYSVAVVTADLDRDGRLDVVVADRRSDDVAYLRGGGSRLSSPQFTTVGSAPTALETGDFNGDGLTELVVANHDSHDVTYLRVNASGLGRALSSPVGSRPRVIVSDDFDNDGEVDAVVANSGSPSDQGSSELTFFRGLVAQSLPEPLEVSTGAERRRTLTVGTFPSSMLTGRFGDPESSEPGDDIYPDLLVASEVSDTLTVFFGGASGLSDEYRREIAFGPNTVPKCLGAGDLDGDGRLDVVVGFERKSYIVVFWGRRDGLSLNDVELVAIAGVDAVGVEVFDVDRDGTDELIVVSTGSGTPGFGAVTVVSQGGGQEPLVASAPILVGQGPVALTRGDFDGDGYVDVVVVGGVSDPTGAGSGSGTVSFLRGDGSSFESTVDELSLGGHPSSLVTGDFDGDGYVDLAVALAAADTVVFLRGGPCFALASGESISTGASPRAVSSGDFNGDGYVDLIVANSLSSNLTFMRGGVRGLERLVEISAGVEPVALEAGDFNGDGFCDLLVANRLSDSVSLFLQRYLTPHVNVELNPGAGVRTLVDPGSPTSYELEVDTDALPHVTQAAVLAVPVFELPRGPEFLGDAITDAICVLPEETEIPAGGVWLTLRIREESGGRHGFDPGDLTPAIVGEIEARLRIFHQGADDVVRDVTPANVVVRDLGDGSGVSFPISIFGTYVGALEGVSTDAERCDEGE